MLLAYSRVSTVEQAADGTTSLAEQERKARGIAQIRGLSAFDVVTYTDAGVSGATPLSERPAGKEMLEAAQAGDVIVASKLDRLFRSASDALSTVEALRKRKVDIIVVDLGSEPITHNGISKLFLGILAVVAEFERGLIEERTVAGRAAKRARNGCVGATPYGYRKVGKGKASTLEPDEHEQMVIAHARRIYKIHRSHNTVAVRLEGMGLLSRTGKRFQPVQIQRMIENKFEITKAA